LDNGDLVAEMFSLRKSMFAFMVAFCAAVSFTGHATGQEKSIVVASTTSKVDSGLFDYLFPIFTHKTGIAVKVLELGTGQALDAGRRGKADVVFVHAKIAELQFIAEGHGVKRFPVMYDDFVMIGPRSDPAGIKGMKDVVEALKAIKEKQATFLSRGDRSGTHRAELALWNKDAGINIQKEKGPWYKSINQGMGTALNMASKLKGYTLADRGTWISFRRKGDLECLLEGDRRMFNQYSAILVNPAKHTNVKREFGQAFIDWLVSPEGQKSIGNYKIEGKQLFYPDADDPNA
jgi:tungstate transport system substrate-binding protein